MSETFQIGDAVVLRMPDGTMHEGAGVGAVTASDVSSVAARFRYVFDIKVNSGSLKYGAAVLSRMTHAEWDAFTEKQQAREQSPISDQAACITCAWWRPPFANGPGNCHNQHLVALTRAKDDGFPPPTTATFGCVHWQTKEEPENGDDSDG
jgi:hypothetical protein